MSGHEPGGVADAVAELWRMEPCPLVGTRGPTFVSLQAWAVDIAADLHDRFPDLGIVVGTLLYPDRTIQRQVDADAYYSGMAILDSESYPVALDGPLAVRSGYDGRHGVVVTNRTSKTVTLWTNGAVTAHVIEPGTNHVVGVSVMGQVAIGIPFKIDPGSSVPVPLVVGTASLDPKLGYAVPPGRWDLQARVTLEEPGGREYLTPPLGFQII